MNDRAAAEVPLSAAGPARQWMPTLAGLSLGEYARSLVRRLAALPARCAVMGGASVVKNSGNTRRTGYSGARS
jgi:hypothetical protein